jgi:LPPG:FO 2-phospho-L-lactate transferase
MKIVALAGGVGGARLADGLAQVLPPGNLTVIVNVGDDFEHLGLYICPDLDTVCYTISGRANLDSGWGLCNESWNALSELRRLGAEDWFALGDRDLATHILRTYYINQGLKLSEITAKFCNSWDIKTNILPVSDDRVPTIIVTQDGKDLTFQEYFVQKNCEPVVKEFRFESMGVAKPADGVVNAIIRADYVVICPSNPRVSIHPILSIPGILESLESKKVIAVSPIIGGRAVKGPAAKMYSEMGIEPSSFAVAQSYRNLIQALVIDNMDTSQASLINDWGIMTLTTNSLMKNRSDRERLAREVLDFCTSNL